MMVRFGVWACARADVGTHIGAANNKTSNHPPPFVPCQYFSSAAFFEVFINQPRCGLTSECGEYSKAESRKWRSALKIENENQEKPEPILDLRILIFQFWLCYF